MQLSGSKQNPSAIVKRSCFERDMVSHKAEVQEFIDGRPTWLMINDVSVQDYNTTSLSYRLVLIHMPWRSRAAEIKRMGVYAADLTVGRLWMMKFVASQGRVTRTTVPAYKMKTHKVGNLW